MASLVRTNLAATLGLQDPADYPAVRVVIRLSSQSCKQATLLFGAGCRLFDLYIPIPSSASAASHLPLVARLALERDIFYSHEPPCPPGSVTLPAEVAARWSARNFFRVLFGAIGWPCDWTLRTMDGAGNDDVRAPSPPPPTKAILGSLDGGETTLAEFARSYAGRLEVALLSGKTPSSVASRPPGPPPLHADEELPKCPPAGLPDLNSDRQDEVDMGRVAPPTHWLSDTLCDSLCSLFADRLGGRPGSERRMEDLARYARALPFSRRGFFVGPLRRDPSLQTLPIAYRLHCSADLVSRLQGRIQGEGLLTDPLSAESALLGRAPLPPPYLSEILAAGGDLASSTAMAWIRGRLWNEPYKAEVPAVPQAFRTMFHTGEVVFRLLAAGELQERLISMGRAAHTAESAPKSTPTPTPTQTPKPTSTPTPTPTTPTPRQTATLPHKLTWSDYFDVHTLLAHARRLTPGASLQDLWKQVRLAAISFQVCGKAGPLDLCEAQVTLGSQFKNLLAADASGWTLDRYLEADRVAMARAYWTVFPDLLAHAPPAHRTDGTKRKHQQTQRWKCKAQRRTQS